MHSYRIEGTRHFMASLLTTDAFHDFLLANAAISTFVTYTIDGALHRDFFSSDSSTSAAIGAKSEDLTPWELIRPHIFSLIRGKQPPLAMKLVLRLNTEEAAWLAAKAALSYDPSAIKGLFLNIHYDQEGVTCVTGTSLAIFTMDRRLDQLWDDWVASFLRRQQIPFAG